MTRFARAKGSKASNERVPNDATPWHVMKQQLLENVDKKQGSQDKDKSEKETSLGKKDLFYSNNIGNVNHDWAEFETSVPKMVKSKTGENSPMKVEKKKKKAKQKKESAHSEQATEPKKDCEHVDNTKVVKNSIPKRKSDCIDDSANETKTKKHKKDKKQLDNEISEQNDNTSHNRGEKKKRKKGEANPNENDVRNNEEVSPEKINLHKKRKTDKHSSKTSITKSTENNTLLANEENNKVNTNETNEKNGAILTKRQKRNKHKRGNTNENTDGKIHQHDGNIANEATEHCKPNFNKNFGNKSNDYNNTSNKFPNRKFDTVQKPNVAKPPKQRDDKEHKRKKPDTYPAKITINGVTMELVRYDGFPVLKADADRLTDLKQQMIIKGIPKNEINMAMTREKRKAQKALARIRNTTCFHCRKSGHNLSDCPELGNEQGGTGICYLCGSTEHTHEQCKGAKAGVFKYATCFICRQQGHITRQCPDNPKGVYPQGGACKICGDVTHLRKDCPDLVKEKEETAITLDTITNDTVEHLEEDRIRVADKANKSTKKIVKF